MRKLTVSSAHGTPDPPNGCTMHQDGEQITCKVTNPANKGLRIWKCTGWFGTGSVPPKGQTASVTFPITQDSEITWNWESGLNGGLVGSFVALALVIVFAITSYVSLKEVLLTAFCVGAIGGLLHEIIQSNGSYIKPTTDEKGNLCLGSLFGIISGGVAGTVLVQALNVTAVSPLVVSQAFTAGLALKGAVDARNPGK
jgi:hypothetical protein